MIQFCKVLTFALALTTVSCSTLNFSWRNVGNLKDYLSALERDPEIKVETTMLLKNIRRVAALGIMKGLINVEAKMEKNMEKMLKDLSNIAQNAKTEKVSKKMKEIESTMMRDTTSIEILKCAVDLAMSKKDVEQCLKVMNKASKKPQKVSTVPLNGKSMNEMQEKVEKHVKAMREAVNSSVQSIGSKEKSKVGLQREAFMNDNFNRDALRLPLHVETPYVLFVGDFENLYRLRRQNDDKKSGRQESENDVAQLEDDEEEFEDSLGPPANSGGLAGLIASLSGGEGGSDVGALVGAISGVVTNLFGPGGLDIPSLLSTGTSLIAGLLSGDENFGKVLGSYIGIAVEGFSGGGGADNNGEFFGNFVGTVLGQLSADPEDESGPQPKIFFDNFFKGFEQTKQKRGADDNSSKGKSYFFEFISNIISSLVGGITSLIVNSSLGSSGGSSQGSGSLSAGSSQGSAAGSAQASQASQPHTQSKPEPIKQSY